MKRLKRFLLGSILVVLLAGALGVATGCDDDHHHRRRIHPRRAYYVSPRRGHPRVVRGAHVSRRVPPPIHRRRPPGWDEDDWEDYLEDLYDD
jgi:hypothetical protein